MRTFLRSYRGTHPLGRSALPCFASESTREGTLMSLPEGAPARSGSGVESVYPENAAAPAQRPSTERRYRPNVTSGCPKRSEGGFPVGTRTIPPFQTELHVSPRVVRPEGFPYSRFRRQNLPRRRSPPQPSAHEYAAPYPAPSPPGTRPRGESPWRSHRDPHRHTAP